jgi:chaperonin GroES
MKVRPLGDKILVKRADAQDKTDAGIFLPESAKDQPKEGKVVALGSGILNKNTGEYMPFTVREGDEVIFSSYSGTEVKIGDEEMLILSEDDILGVIE